MTAPAMTGPAPNSPVRLVPAARTAAVVSSWSGGSGCQAAQILGELGGKLQVGRLHRPCWCDRCQDLSGLACGDLLADAAGDQLAQHLVQPAGHLGAGLAQVPVALGPHLKHCRVIISPGFPDLGGAQRDDRH